MQFESERLGPDESGGEDVIDLRRIVRTLMSRKWWVIGSIVASLALALAYSSLKTPLYQTRAKLLVDGGRRGSRSPGSIMDLAAGMEGERSLSTQLQILLARRRTEAAARLVAIRQILLATSDGEADDPALFLDVPSEIKDQLAPRLKDIKDNVDLDALRTSKNLTADPLEILLVHCAQSEDVQTKRYPPGIIDVRKAIDRAVGSIALSKTEGLARQSILALAGGCSAGVTPQIIDQTDVISIMSQSSIPALAAAYANALADEHSWRSLSSSREAATRGLEWVGADDKPESRLFKAKEESEAAQDKLASLLLDSGLGSIPASATAMTARVQGLSQSVSVMEATVRASGAEVVGLQQEMAAQKDWVVAKSTTSSNPAIPKLESTLSELESERAVLLETVTEVHPGVTEIDARIRELTQQLTEEVDAEITLKTEIKNPLGEQLVAQLAQARVRLMRDEATLAATRPALARAEADLAGVPIVQQEAARLERDVQLAEMNYLELAELAQQLELTQASEIGGVSVLESARIPTHSVSPNKRLNLMLGLMVGIVLGLTIAFVIEQLDNTIKDADELEDRFGLPVLAAVPQGPSNGDHARLSLEPDSDHQAMAEAFRSLRTNIRYSRADSPPEVIMVTSSGMGEGKTTTAINLAMAHIQAGDRVILVDGDLRRPAVAKGLKIEGDKGLSSYLIGEESVEPMIQHPDDFGGLAVLPSGPTPPNPARLLESNKLATLMTSLREKYDLVIIDSPPTGLLSDTQVLAPLADGVVLVADATKTRRPMFQRALKQLMRTGTPCLGGIMNRVPTRRGGYYDYHYGGHYGGGAGKGKKK